MSSKSFFKSSAELVSASDSVDKNSTGASADTFGVSTTGFGFSTAPITNVTASGISFCVSLAIATHFTSIVALVFSTTRCGL